MRRLLIVALVVLAPAACGAGDDGAAATVTLNVAAAASLTDAFTDLGRLFEVEHPEARVAFSFAASSALAHQVNDGAPVDVFASADEASMKKVTDAANASAPVTIARNRLTILVETGNPKAVAGLADLARGGLVVVMCAPEVPCGRFAALTLQKAGLVLGPASLEENVKAVVSKVTLGEADAGIVYVTDAKAAAGEADAVAIDIAADPALEAVYPMAMTKQADHRDAARAWIAFVQSADGQAVLRGHGFLAP